VTAPDSACLFAIASEQHGYFTAQQAARCGIGRRLLSYHAKTGRFHRMRRGLYRLRNFPSSPYDEVLAAWLAAGRDTAVVSHESALDLLDLADVIPAAVHLTVPRSRRDRAVPPGAVLHTTLKPPQDGEITTREGIRLTAATRTILDVAEAGTAPEQVDMAVTTALRRGWTTAAALRQGATSRSGRVARLLKRTLEEAGEPPSR
jgi:predicted transcriptional regulator of viral defense system